MPSCNLFHSLYPPNRPVESRAVPPGTMVWRGVLVLVGAVLSPTVGVDIVDDQRRARRVVIIMTTRVFWVIVLGILKGSSNSLLVQHCSYTIRESIFGRSVRHYRSCVDRRSATTRLIQDTTRN